MTTKFERVKPPGADHLIRRLEFLERQVRSLRAARRLESASIGRGGLTVRNEGSIVVVDGGALKVAYPTGEDGITVGSLGSGEGVSINMSPADGDFSRTFAVDHYIFPEYGTDSWRMVFRGDDVEIEGSGAQIVMGGGTLNLEAADGHQVQILSPATAFEGFAVSGSLDYFGAPTTGSAANVNYNTTTGRIRVVTSSRRFKENIKPAEIDVEAALALEPKTYTRTDEEEDPEKVFAGFVAEEAADLNLDHWVTRDEDGEPYAFDYSQWCVALQAIARSQAGRIESLETRVADQDRTIADLTARLEALESKTTND